MHDPHVTHDPHIAHSMRVVGKRNERGNYCGKNSAARAPVHRSGPGPITPRAYMWPRPGGSCWCTKVGVPFCTPLLVRGQSQPHAPGHAWRGRGSKGTRRLDQRQAGNTKSRRARWTLPTRPLPGGLHSPGKNLAGATRPTSAGLPPLSLRVPTPSTTLEPKLGRRLRGGMQIFVKTKNIQD